MKKVLLLIVSIAIVALVGGAFVTCPDKKAHQKALTESVGQYAQDKVDSKGGVLGKVAKAVAGNKAVELAISQFLTVEDHGVFSIGKIKKGEDSQIVSFGIFGKVYAPSTAQIDAALKKK